VLPSSKRYGIVYDYILVVYDGYTKIVRYLVTTKTINTTKLAELFFKEIILRFRTSNSVVSDRDSILTSTF